MTEQEFPDRPEHPDFWLMASVVQDYDMVMDDAKTMEEKHRRHDNLVNQMIDAKSLAYLAVQRGIRANDIDSRLASRDAAERVSLLASVYHEAFLVGMETERRRRGRADKMPPFVPFDREKEE